MLWTISPTPSDDRKQTRVDMSYDFAGKSSSLHRVNLRCPLISSLKWTRRTLFDIVRVEVMMVSLVEVVRPVGHHPHPEE